MSSSRDYIFAMLDPSRDAELCFHCGRRQDRLGQYTLVVRSIDDTPRNVHPRCHIKHRAELTIQRHDERTGR